MPSYIGDFYLGLTGANGAPIYLGYDWLLAATFTATNLADGEGTAINAFGGEPVVVREAVGVVAEMATDFLGRVTKTQ